ncbi:membrane protein [Candidatus Marinamargulisbacteria bacterium SCGC AG-410-N11]|nr:membrane protein [Candidatus Marinamargulisbacteria bacterium SCGC AG-410-N11]
MNFISRYKFFISFFVWRGDYCFSRWLLIRFFGFIYFFAFLVFVHQFPGLLGSKGILPTQLFIDQLLHQHSLVTGFLRLPSLFLFSSSDVMMTCIGWGGLLLSLLVIAGCVNGFIFLLLWILYLSIVNGGQLFYGFGWEMMMLELGFLSIFLVPFWTFKGQKEVPSKLILFLILWFLFRVMFGAGLIKLRGDVSWRDLTALFYHFETQPIPNILSSYFHFLPKFILKIGVLFNHVAELIIPFFYFGPLLFRRIGGMVTILFQVILILSGHLSWLNWLTILLCIPCFDDQFWKWLLPKRLVSFILGRNLEYCQLTRFRRVVIGVLFGLILFLSFQPIQNLFSKKQLMNASFDSFHIVNTYGAFGHVGKVRRELVLEATLDSKITKNTVWVPYEFNAKPGNLNKASPILFMYHYRLDWQIWFAAMSSYQYNPWVVHLIYKLLNNEQVVNDLFYKVPFPNRAPSYIRVLLYEYRLTNPYIRQSSAYWERSFRGIYLPALSRNDGSLLDFLSQYGWIK